MLKHDYILRLVQQLAQALRRLLARRNEAPEEVAREADAALGTLAGLDLATVRSLPLPALLALMRQGTEVDPGRTLAIAEILAVQADADASLGDEELARRERERAAALYLETFLHFRDDALAPSIERAEMMLAGMVGIDDAPLPAEVAVRLVAYRELEGRFADAEDALFELLRHDPGSAAAIGVPFFRRLLSRPDAELEGGGLPRDEVVEGLAELERATERRRA
jgi:hypothetical protein